MSSKNSGEELFLQGVLEKGLEVEGKEKVNKIPTTCFKF